MIYKISKCVSKNFKYKYGQKQESPRSLNLLVDNSPPYNSSEDKSWIMLQIGLFSSIPSNLKTFHRGHFWQLDKQNQRLMMAAMFYIWWSKLKIYKQYICVWTGCDPFHKIQRVLLNENQYF